jgi:hypothetical protein
MSYEDFKNLTSGVNSIVSSVAILVGASWAYFKFVRTREGAPKIAFWVELDFIQRQGGLWIAEAVAHELFGLLCRSDFKSQRIHGVPNKAFVLDLSRSLPILSLFQTRCVKGLG